MLPVAAACAGLAALLWDRQPAMPWSLILITPVCLCTGGFYADGGRRSADAGCYRITFTAETALGRHYADAAPCWHGMRTRVSKKEQQAAGVMQKAEISYLCDILRLFFFLTDVLRSGYTMHQNTPTEKTTENQQLRNTTGGYKNLNRFLRGTDAGLD